MTQEEIDRIQENVASMTPGELMEQSRKRNALVEKAKRLKKLRKWK